MPIGVQNARHGRGRGREASNGGPLPLLLRAAARMLDRRCVVARSRANAHSLAPPCLGFRPASAALCKSVRKTSVCDTGSQSVCPHKKRRFPLPGKRRMFMLRRDANTHALLQSAADAGRCPSNAVLRGCRGAPRLVVAPKVRTRPLPMPLSWLSAGRGRRRNLS